MNIISTFCTQFQISALNFNFLHCMGLIDKFSANEHAEMFACGLLISQQILTLFLSKGAQSNLEANLAT